MAGIIISSPSLVPGVRRPKSGGTGAALSALTELPVIKMHIDALARPDEQAKLATLVAGDTVYITGHGNIGVTVLSGEYHSPDTLLAPVTMRWTLEQYCDLILKNASLLKEGDSIDIVLWACKAGAGGVNSTAAQMGKLFSERGISTRIICSTDLVDRFNGMHLPGEIEEHKLQFRSPTEALRVFEFQAHSPVINESFVMEPIYCTKSGVIGIKLESESQRREQELRAHPQYRSAATRLDAERELLSKPLRSYILRESSIRVPDARVVCATVKYSKGTYHLLICINPNGEIFQIDDKGKPKERGVTFSSEQKLATAVQQIVNSFTESKKESNSSAVFFKPISPTSSRLPACSSSTSVLKPAFSSTIILPRSQVAFTYELAMKQSQERLLTVSKTFADELLQSRLSSSTYECMYQCRRVLKNDTDIDSFISNYLSANMASAVQSLKNPEATELCLPDRMNIFIHAVEELINKEEDQQSTFDLAFTVNFMSILLHRPVDEHNLKDCLDTLKANWDKSALAPQLF